MLTLEESALLERLDADIAAVARREYEQSLPTTSVQVPPVLSASLLMRAASDPDALALDLARPMPRVASDAAALGTAFHAWVAASHEQLSLIPEWDAAQDESLVDDTALADLIAGYRRTVYASMVPAASETEISVRIGGVVVRGVVDAVYQHPDGTWEIVDWKTTRAQTADPVQLSVYRLGWAQRQGVPVEQVTAAFVYVRDAEVVRPPLLTAAELEQRVAQRVKEAETAQ